MNGNTDQRGLRVVKASYPCVRLCVWGKKRGPVACLSVCKCSTRLHFLCTFTLCLGMLKGDAG